MIRERDEARDALSKVTVGATAPAAAPATGERMEVDGQEVPEKVQNVVDETKGRLSAGRKKRPIPDGWATGEDVGAFQTTFTSDAVVAGAKALKLSESGDHALVGGADGAAVYLLAGKQVVTTLKADDGAVNDVLFAGTRAITGSANGVVRVWAEEGTDSSATTAHAGAVTAIDLHPSKSLLASVGVDKSWILYDLETTKSVIQLYDENGKP